MVLSCNTMLRVMPVAAQVNNSVAFVLIAASAAAVIYCWVACHRIDTHSVLVHLSKAFEWLLFLGVYSLWILPSKCLKSRMFSLYRHTSHFPIVSPYEQIMWNQSHMESVCLTLWETPKLFPLHRLCGRAPSFPGPCQLRGSSSRGMLTYRLYVTPLKSHS